MTTLPLKIMALFILLAMLYAVQVKSAPLPEEVDTGLIQRAKRSLLWRWNTMKPVGASCREHSECGTKHCRRNTCSFRVFST